MENENEPNRHVKQNASSTLSMYPPNSNSPESALPPPYSNPSQYPPTSGMPYPHQYPPPNSAMGYPQPYAPTPGGQPYYPQPGVGYPGPPVPNYHPSQPQQQQQQQVVVVNNQPMGVAPVFVVGEPRLSMTGAIALSCIVYWCCGWLFGGIAFILAMVGQSSAAAGDIRGAIRLRNASIALSIVGIVIAVTVVGVAAGVLSAATRRNYYYYNCPTYYTYGSYRSSYYYYCK